ncbi:MAG TPA: zf-TFIIB domain-containing protein [Vicinamibacterales bacterium]|nr:zf-TFIIB domain-containing protein [Vicinamibacterales bacterium]
MNCLNCGGAMQLFATRGYFFCRYCGSYHFPETAVDDGVRVLSESPQNLQCPACAGRLSTALLDPAHPVHHCRTCRGVLMPRGTFADVVRVRRAWAQGPPAAPVPLQQDELRRSVLCPVCRKSLTTHPYLGPGNVVIDSCDSCDVIWLDFGELRQIVNAPGKDRGGREGTAARAADWEPVGPARDDTGVGAEPPAIDLLDAMLSLFDR